MFLFVKSILAQWAGFNPVVREGTAGMDKDYYLIREKQKIWPLLVTLYMCIITEPLRKMNLAYYEAY